MDVESRTDAGEIDRGFEDLAQRLRAESQRLATRYPPGHIRLEDIAKGASPRFRRRWAAWSAAAALLLTGGTLTWNALNRPAQKPQPDGPRPIARTGLEEPLKAQDPSPVAGAPENAEPVPAMLVWRFVITSPDEQGGRRVVATGVYIPEQRRNVTFDELSPAEQYAVLRALGADQKPQWQL